MSFKIVRLTKEQLEALENNDTVGTETGLNDDNLYMVEASLFNAAEEIGSGTIRQSSSWSTADMIVKDIHEYDFIIIVVERETGIYMPFTLLPDLLTKDYVVYYKEKIKGITIENQCFEKFYLGEGRWFSIKLRKSNNASTYAIMSTSNLTESLTYKVYGVVF